MRATEIKVSNTVWYVRPFFWNQRRKYGQVLKPALLLLKPALLSANSGHFMIIKT